MISGTSSADPDRTPDSRSIKLRKMRHQEERKVWSSMSESARLDYQDPLPPLKLVIMSATLRVEDFCVSKLFSPIPPVIKVEARQYPVAVHFSRRTELRDYLKEAYRKVVQIHRRLPEGGILVFLTGRHEVLSVCKKLERAFNKKDFENQVEAEDCADESQALFHGLDQDEGMADEDVRDDIDDEGLDDDDGGSMGEEDYDDLGEQMLQEAIRAEKSSMTDESVASAPSLKAKILPLYAMMSSELQQQVFQALPSGYRLIVIATNVAETSITIPNITYVVDTGRQKERVTSMVTGISKYEIRWISKASAEQRKGRAGRTNPGHVYRLYR
jgi:ATP-dependent RNA helicase DHX37/DHR1